VHVCMCVCVTNDDGKERKKGESDNVCVKRLHFRMRGKGGSSSV